MSAGGKASQPQAAAAFSLSSSTLLQSSVLTLATLTLLSFTYFSYNSNSLHYSPPPPTTTTTTSTSQLYPSKLEVVEVEKQKQKQKEREEDDDDDVSWDVYHLPQIFGLNYAEMERRFKVYIYPDGDPNTFYQTPRKLTGKYASEGYFFQNIRESTFRTHDPNQAQLFFIPISCHKMRGKVCLYANAVLCACLLLNFFYIYMHQCCVCLLRKPDNWNL